MSASTSPPPAAESFLAACTAGGATFYTGVPCSYLSGAFAALESRPTSTYLPAPREDLAMGAAAGAWLGGGAPVVLLQNSGLGTGLNALQSLLQMFHIGCTLVVSWRGQAGHVDAPEHSIPGQQMMDLLRLCAIPVTLLDDPAGLAAQTSQVVRQAMAARQVQALVVPHGVLDARGSVPAAAAAPQREAAAPLPAGLPARLPTAAAVQRLMAAIVQASPEAAIVACNGFIGRDVFACGDRPQNFYMLGSMGLACSIATGLALAQPQRPVVVLDGDGNVLMGLGGLAMVGAARPANLFHFVLNNGVHRSTGNQPSLAASVDLCGMAAACGYRQILRLPADDAPAIAQAMRAAGPVLVEVPCTPDAGGARRISLPPADVAWRCRQHLTGD